MQQNPASNNRLQNQHDLNQQGSNISPERRRVRESQANTNIFRVGASEEIVLFIQDNKILFLSGKTDVIDPMDENYFTLLRNSFSPNLHPLSMTTFLVLANTACYIISLCFGFDQTASLLQVKADTLMMMGMNDSHYVYKGEVYRLFASLFLHINLLHLLSNLIIMVLLVSRIQYTLGIIRTLSIYLVSGMGGGILSNILYPLFRLKAGSSNSLYGMIGLVFGYIIINWSGMAIIGCIFKFKLILLFFLISGYLLLFTDVAPEIDYYGHLGGFAGGLFLSGINPTLQKTKRQQTLRIIFIILFAAIMAACFIFYYLIPSSSYQ